MQTTSTSPDNNSRGIANSFETPEWYLSNYAANIRVRSETVEVLLRNRTFENILDIGCGDGSLSLPLLSRSHYVTFLDQSSAMLNKVKARISAPQVAHISYINTDFMTAAVPKAAFDLIICVGVIAYIKDIDAFLAKISSALSPGGTLIFECTDAAHLLCRIDRTYQSITGLLKSRDFSIYKHTASEVLAAAKHQHLHLERTFRYAYNVSLIWRFFSQATTYKIIRRIYGDIDENKCSSLGNQCLFVFKGN